MVILEALGIQNAVANVYQFFAKIFYYANMPLNELFIGKVSTPFIYNYINPFNNAIISVKSFQGTMIEWIVDILELLGMNVSVPFWAFILEFIAVYFVAVLLWRAFTLFFDIIT